MTPRLQPFAAIHEALCDAFTLESLERMVSLGLGRELYDYAAAGNMPQVVSELLGAARRGGFLDDLVIAARRANPGNQKLAALPPTRGEELRYLRRLIEEVEKLAQLYSPLRGIAAMRPPGMADFLPAALEDDPNLSPLVWEQRKRALPERREAKPYDDILDAYREVNRVALLGAPGSGKSTTLRKLAVKLARDAEANPDAPLPVLAALGKWTDDKRLGEFLAQAVGFAIEGLGEARRLVLLLDGLNEVPTALRGDKAREVRRLGYANINETWGEVGPHKLERTSAVGIYPEGRSPEGILDLSGNVWEWCLNEYEKPDRTQASGRGSRVLRGGSWLFFQVYARAVGRYLFHPGFRFDYIGFRVVCWAPSAEH